MIHRIILLSEINTANPRAVEVVWWSASLPSTLLIRVQILLLITVLYLEKAKINAKEPGFGPFEKNTANPYSLQRLRQLW